MIDTSIKGFSAVVLNEDGIAPGGTFWYLKRCWGGSELSIVDSNPMN